MFCRIHTDVDEYKNYLSNAFCSSMLLISYYYISINCPPYNQWSLQLYIVVTYVAYLASFCSLATVSWMYRLIPRSRSGDPIAMSEFLRVRWYQEQMLLYQNDGFSIPEAVCVPTLIGRTNSRYGHPKILPTFSADLHQVPRSLIHSWKLESCTKPPVQDQCAIFGKPVIMMPPPKESQPGPLPRSPC